MNATVVRVEDNEVEIAIGRERFVALLITGDVEVLDGRHVGRARREGTKLDDRSRDQGRTAAALADVFDALEPIITARLADGSLRPCP